MQASVPVGGLSIKLEIVDLQLFLLLRPIRESFLSFFCPNGVDSVTGGFESFIPSARASREAPTMVAAEHISRLGLR